MDFLKWGKILTAVAGAVTTILVTTHNMDPKLAAEITGGIAAFLGLLTANDHNTAA